MELTQAQWKEFQVFKEEYAENETQRNLLLQRIDDTISGGLRSANIAEYRNTYVINAQDSLDADIPMYVHFNIISEMTKIVSIKLSFWLLNFRAYSKSAAEKEAVTSGASSEESSASGGGETPTSGTTTPFGSRSVIATGASVTGVGNEGYDGYLVTSITTLNVVTSDHTHDVTISSHTHEIAHTHAIPAHKHDLTFGIFEEENSPTIGFQISRDNGKTYGAILGNYKNDVENLEIKDYITTKGSKIVKFTSNARARLSVQITVKLDISAR